MINTDMPKMTAVVKIVILDYKDDDFQNFPDDFLISITLPIQSAQAPSRNIEKYEARQT